MTATIRQILHALNQAAPFRLAESWDNIGLLIGSGSSPVSTLMVCLDPTLSTLEEAKERGCDAIITHHPIIFKPLAAIDTDTPTGKFIARALNYGISTIACHTNLDNAHDSVSDILARKLGLEGLRPLLPGDDPETGSGCIGTTGSKVAGIEFIKNIINTLEIDAITVSGAIPEQVENVALCGGSGSGFAEAAQKSGADIYITSEVKHSTARWAEDAGFCIVDASHYATEKFAVNLLQQQLEKAAEENGWNLNIKKSKTEQHPFAAIVKDSPVLTGTHQGE